MRQDRLLVLLSIAFAMTGVLILAEALPNLVYLPFLIISPGFNTVGLELLFGLLGPLVTISVAVYLILRRQKLAEKLMYVVDAEAEVGTPESDVAFEEIPADESEDSEQFNSDAELPELEAEMPADGAEIDQDPVTENDELEDHKFTAKLYQNRTWAETIPRIALAVLGFYLVATGVVPVLAALLTPLLHFGSSFLDIDFNAQIFWFGVVRGVAQVLIGFLLIVHYSRIVSTWHLIWGRSITNSA